MQHLAGITIANAGAQPGATQAWGGISGNAAAALRTATSQLGIQSAQSSVTISAKSLNLSQARPPTGSMPVHSTTSPSGPKPANYGAGMYQAVSRMA